MAYTIWMHAARGQTLGKIAFDVIVLDVSERPLSVTQAFQRDIFNLAVLPLAIATGVSAILDGQSPDEIQKDSTLGYVLSYSLLSWFVVEMLTMLASKRRRAFHDLIAGSVVVRVEPPFGNV